MFTRRRGHSHSLPFTMRGRLASARGAIDLASIMVGVIIISIISTVALAVVYGVIPWTQDKAAQESLRAVQTAQTIARAQFGSYQTTAELVAHNILPAKVLDTASGTITGGRGASVAPRVVTEDTGPTPGVPEISVNDERTCYVTAVQSTTGRVFWLSSTTDGISSADPGATPQPNTSGCAAFPKVADWNDPQLDLDYTKQYFDLSANNETLAPTVTNAAGPVAFTCTTETGEACAPGVKNWPEGATFNPATGDIAGPATWPASAVAVASGRGSVCAIGADTGVKCWGDNLYGQLGTGQDYSTMKKSGTPRDVMIDATTKLTKVKAIDLESPLSGNPYACAVTDMTVPGGVYCWGSNAQSQLGDPTFVGTLRAYARPVMLNTSTQLSGVSQIAEGAYHTCVLVGTAMKCWGSNSYQQLGAAGPNSPTPATIPGAYKKVVAGGNTTCAITTAGGVSCLGDNGENAFGDGTSVGWTPTPTPVPALSSGVTDLAIGEHNGCAVISEKLKCWGHNWSNTISGDPATTIYPTPVDMPQVTDPVKHVTITNANACIVTTAGAAKCWGAYINGRLGDKGTAQANTANPQQVSKLTGGVTGPVTIGVGGSCAVAYGSVVCWGMNDSGQLGNGTIGTSTTGFSYAPAKVPGSGGVFDYFVGPTVTASDGRTSVTKQLDLSVR